ncbi:hypothetical protein GCM10027026_06420 [Myroides odoratimimus subsp. xuanwuensis]
MVAFLLAGLWVYVMAIVINVRFPSAALGIVAEIFILGVSLASVAVCVVWHEDIVEAGLGRAALLISPALYLTVRDLYEGQFDHRALTFVGITLAIAAARPRLRVLRVLAVLLIVTAATALLMGVLVPSVGLTEVDTAGNLRTDKQLLPGLGMLVGMYPHENSLGQSMALGFPLVLLLRRSRARWLGGLVVVVACVWSSSRGSLAAIALTVVLVLGLSLITDRGLRSRAERLVIGASVGVLVALPFLLRPEDDAFTSRGSIWRNSITAWWQSDPLWGLGSRWFTDMQENSASSVISAASHAHNQAVQAAVTGGVILLGLFILQIGVVTRLTTMTHSRDDVVASAFVASLVVSSWLELTVGYVDGMMTWPWTFPVLAVLVFRRDGGARRTRRPVVRHAGDELAGGAATLDWVELQDRAVAREHGPRR